MNKITRSTVNEQQYSAPAFSKSGFPLSYRRYDSWPLGRICVGGFHFTMPGDKIAGRTSSDNITFKRLVTPLVSPVNAMQYNVFLPFRPLDRSFKKGMTPTKLNAMSANWSMPTVNTYYLVDQLLRAYCDVAYNADYDNDFPSWFKTLWIIVGYGLDATVANQVSQAITGGALPATFTFTDWLYNASTGFVTNVIKNLTENGHAFTNMADDLYLRDALLDIANSISAKLGNTDNPLSDSMLVSDFCQLIFETLLEPFVGRRSYYAQFKYEYLRPWDFYLMFHQLGQNAVVTSYADFSDAVSHTGLNEYPLRAMYAIWYELFRNVDLEPVSSSLPDWQEWSSTSIFDMANGGNLLYLIWRIRSWEKDQFISAQIDDISRHVYAPVIDATMEAVAYHVDDVNNLDIQYGDAEEFKSGGNHTPSTYRLGYHDSFSGNNVFVTCPVPANINDILSATDNSFKDVYGLDLNTLRQSQMLERYLKRNYLFGDEYQDRILAHYNTRVSDMRINKPEVLSQSLDGYDMRQEVSNVSTGISNVGDRTATATININGNEFATFCEEFGIIVSIVCFMPRAMYDGTTPQLLCTKQVDMPLPEFAANNEEFGRKLEIAGSGLITGAAGNAVDNNFMFGRYPAYHAWRSRVDEVGGDFLNELQDCTFRRFFGMYSDDTTPKLNYFFIHCRPNLQMFANTVLYDTQLYGDLVHDCYVERVLPTPVETI